jgi:hypothetical protein
MKVMRKIVWILFALIIVNYSGIVSAQSPVNEIVSAHVSKNIVVAGESVWFSVLATGVDKKIYSKIAYAELVDKNGQAVAQTILNLEAGSSEGYLEIPTQLNSDHYLFRFYTRISPFGENSGVFNQFITVINPNKPPKKLNSRDINDANGFKKPILAEVSDRNQINPNAEVVIPLPESKISKPFSISVSLKNPYLAESFQGFTDGRIYKKPINPENIVPEPFGHIIWAKNLNPEIDTTETFFLSAHGGQSILISAKPNEKGDLFFELGALKDYDFFIIQSSNIEKQLNLTPKSPFLEFKFQDDFVFPDLVIEEKDKPFLQNLITSSQVTSYFYEVTSSEFSPVVAGFLADRTYYLNDYNRFDNISTTLKEYVPEVWVRKQEKKTLFKVLNNPLNSVFEENPLIIIDAMPVFDVDALAEFDPKNIQRLEVLTREFILNDDKFSGVVSFSSFENDFGGFELPEQALYFNYTEIQKPRKLPSPHFNDNLEDPNFPDFRSTLYWNYQGTSSDNLLFYTSEIKGEYEAIISKVSEGGILEFLKIPLSIKD